MMPKAPKSHKKIQDETTATIYAALKQAFPELPDEPERVIYRYNSVSVRVRIVSQKFRGKSMAEREEMVNEALGSVPPEMTDDISILFMLTPGEAKKPQKLLIEFDNPTDRYL